MRIVATKVPSISRVGAKSLMIAALWTLASLRIACSAHAGITIDDHVRRAQIPVAAISPNGDTAAWLMVRANPLKDVYEVSVRAADARRKSAVLTLAAFELQPNEAFHENSGAFLRSGADLRWVSDELLVFTSKAAGTARLESWKRSDESHRVLMDGHDRIELKPDVDSDALEVLSRDCAVRPAPREAAADHSMRILDDYRFYGPLKNPTLSSWTRTQRWTLSLDRQPAIAAAGAPMEDWESRPEQWAQVAAGSGAQVQESADERTYRTNPIKSPDKALSVASEYTRSKLLEPGATINSMGLGLQEKGAWRSLVPPDTALASLSVIGWGSDSKAVFYIASAAEETSVNMVALNGGVRTLYSAPALLELPGSSAPSSQALSKNGRTALFVRSTNTMPAELVSIDLRSGALTVLDSPNERFSQRADATVKFYPITAVGAKAWGRLYLPHDRSGGRRYPLVITQYLSTPGYYASVGDEIPILPLVAQGIAVFAMHSYNLNNTSSVGDFRMEIDRVEQPRRGMEAIVQQLASEGVIDPLRVGLAGLSYGAEIASYAYWKSQLFRAVSVATTAWDPSLMVFGGVGYGAYMDQRGFPHFAAAGSEKWRDLVPGLNAGKSLPPLLIQSPDGEQNITVPTWMQLRRAGAPVEWLEYPDEGHVKRGPANKWWVFQRNLDWFRFWLKGEADLDPAKADQYARWRQIRGGDPAEP